MSLIFGHFVSSVISLLEMTIFSPINKLRRRLKYSSVNFTEYLRQQHAEELARLEFSHAEKIASLENELKECRQQISSRQSPRLREKTPKSKIFAKRRKATDSCSKRDISINESTDTKCVSVLTNSKGNTVDASESRDGNSTTIASCQAKEVKRNSAQVNERCSHQQPSNKEVDGKKNPVQQLSSVTDAEIVEHGGNEVNEYIDEIKSLTLKLKDVKAERDELKKIVKELQRQNQALKQLGNVDEMEDLHEHYERLLQDDEDSANNPANDLDNYFTSVDTKSRCLNENACINEVLHSNTQFDSHEIPKLPTQKAMINRNSIHAANCLHRNISQQSSEVDHMYKDLMAFMQDLKQSLDKSDGAGSSHPRSS